MPKEILVPLDGSPNSEAVLPYVERIAGGLKNSVTLLFAVERSIVDYLGNAWGPGNHIQGISDRAEERARNYLERQAGRFRELSVPVETIVEHGSPPDVILKRCDESDTALIAMSTRGRSSLRRTVLGSVSNRILHSAAVPLLLIHPDDDSDEDKTPLSEAIVPLDTSARAEAILPLVREYAKALNLRIILVMALPDESGFWVGIDPVPYPSDVIERGEEVVSEYLRDVSNRIRGEDGLEVTWKILRGDAGDAIVDYAREVTNNMIFMSTHGNTGPARWMLGSITDRVMRGSGDPVIIVRSFE